MIEELEYRGEHKNKICSICKLGLDKDRVILTCPQCGSLFHKEHLIEWLEINSECPVCEYDFSNITHKYTIKQNGVYKPDEIDWRDTQTQQDFSIENLDRFSSQKGKLVYGIIFGIVFASFATVMCNLFVPFPFVLLFSIPGIIFFLAGIAVIKNSIQSYRNFRDNPWSNIVFAESNIIINHIDLSAIELNTEDIKSIILDLSEESRENSSRRDYKVSFKIRLHKDRNLHFGEIYKSQDLGDREHYYRFLNHIISTRYNIEILQSDKRFGNWIKSNKITLMLSSIMYIILSVVLILINYFFPILA